MGKLQVRLREDYPNEFLTTTSGYVVRHKEWTEVDEDDYEVQQLLKAGKSLEVNIVDSNMDQKIVSDKPGENTIKEVATANAMKENKSTIEEVKGKSESSSESVDSSSEDKPDDSELPAKTS